MSKEQRILSYIKEELKSENAKEKFLDILSQRMEDNRKALSRLFLVLLLTAIAFPLIAETKITEISIGPFKIIDSNIALAIIPSIFTYAYYKYLLIWFDFVEQKRTYRFLTLDYFKLKPNSFLNDRLNPFSISDSISRHHTQERFDAIGCLSYLLWIPTAFVLIFLPFGIEFYLIKEMFETIKPVSFIDWVIVLVPILIALFTILSLIQVIKNDLKGGKNNEAEKAST
ncbi:hypothetical protein [uncultured Lacinutrix sp.]|uniref:hypothetical protein n=1 Tax=uncultured Lacinutrix sp. TaxID=574032 RepID=UPI00261CA6F8|nr:hypothetical protein [uncultured Lacinutrix sp.]